MSYFPQSGRMTPQELDAVAAREREARALWESMKGQKLPAAARVKTLAAVIKPATPAGTTQAGAIARWQFPTPAPKKAPTPGGPAAYWLDFWSRKK